jgi:radical SAM/Cys-rich protein
MSVRVIDRCNLTVLNEVGFEDLAGFLAGERVEITASLPCYTRENVDRQRGDHVFDSSILALQKLNALGYGNGTSGLVLNLVYNPLGPFLPPPQDRLEADYKRELSTHFGVVFDHLYTLANMPIKRFGSTLVSQGKFASYMALLHSAHNPANLDSVMCRTLVSVDYRGYLYDCDFNQMLGIPMIASGKARRHVTELLTAELTGVPIAVADHCYGCTAGQGSSCGGALA